MQYGIAIVGGRAVMAGGSRNRSNTRIPSSVFSVDQNPNGQPT